MPVYTCIFREIASDCPPENPDPFTYMIETRAPLSEHVDSEWVENVERTAGMIRFEESEINSTLQLVFAFEGAIPYVFDNRT